MCFMVRVQFLSAPANIRVDIGTLKPFRMIKTKAKCLDGKYKF